MGIALKTIISVEHLLGYENLAIPDYQRPYRWDVRNVSQLIEDIQQFTDKGAYRLGTIVLHKQVKEKKIIYNIVDGQQRTVTLLLLAKAIIAYKRNYKNPVLIRKINVIENCLISLTFESRISFYHIKQNYQEIQRAVARMKEKQIFFLFEKCEMVQFVLTDISEAFQFFDAQNARGKDLDPHDLLKAYHLREFLPQDIPLQNGIVSQWEDTRSEELAKLFADYLYRIKSWVKGNSSRYFGKDNISLFKGLRLDKTQSYPYTIPLRIAHYFTDDYNNHLDRKIDNLQRSYPFQLDQIIINGRRFFEFVNYYKNIIDTLYQSDFDDIPLENSATLIFEVLQTYPSRLRTGDQYARALFDCALIFYIDKFQYEKISRAVEKIFIWAYTLRLRYQNLGFASVDNYVIQELNIFKIISDSITPAPIINLALASITQVNGRRIKELLSLFENLKYYDE